MTVNKYTVISTVLMLVIMALFWSGSRYPQLNEKAIMGGDTMLENPLSFESILTIQRGDGLAKKVVYTAINWADENTIGMMFGILMGAGLMTLLEGLRRKSFKSSWANTLAGMGVGVPMGVCVNCAAPIAKGLHDSGSRLEMTLSTMFSSPTLNVIVLTILFSIFPLYLALIKLVLTLLFIAFLVPICCKFFFSKELDATVLGASCGIRNFRFDDDTPSWNNAVVIVLRQYCINLVYIIVRTIPLMLLAGLLGAIFVNVFPLDSLKDLPVNLLGGILVAFIGVTLPLPIALDLVLAASLLASGLPTFYVGILLFAFGIYSIYPFFIIWKSISKRVALVLGIVIMVVSILAGYTADYWDQREMAAFYEYINE